MAFLADVDGETLIASVVVLEHAGGVGLALGSQVEPDKLSVHDLFLDFLDLEFRGALQTQLLADGSLVPSQDHPVFLVDFNFLESSQHDVIL